LQAGDALDISYELNPEFNQAVIPPPDGYITGSSQSALSEETLRDLERI
jgi:hypothetical protein